MRIKKGDKVKVITGAYKGTIGEVKAVFPKEDRVIVEGVNMVKKHLKPTQANPDGGIIEKEAKIHVSIVMLYDEKAKVASRITTKVEVTKAKKSIANFKLREGMPIGCKVTLRKEKMYEFLDKLFNISLPRVRDFRGVSDTSFDGRGNYTLGIKEQIIFPEIDFDKVDRTRGMDIVIVTSAKTNEEAKALLTQMGMPFKK